jgi:hypothetical protein
VAPLRAPSGAGEPGAAHQQRNGVVADHDPAAKAQLGVHPQGAVGLQLGDAALGHGQLGLPAAGQDRLETPIDVVLASPAVDRLV